MLYAIGLAIILWSLAQNAVLLAARWAFQRSNERRLRLLADRYGSEQLLDNWTRRTIKMRGWIEWSRQRLMTLHMSDKAVKAASNMAPTIDNMDQWIDPEALQEDWTTKKQEEEEQNVDDEVRKLSDKVDAAVACYRADTVKGGWQPVVIEPRLQLKLSRERVADESCKHYKWTTYDHFPKGFAERLEALMEVFGSCRLAPLLVGQADWASEGFDWEAALPTISESWAPVKDANCRASLFNRMSKYLCLATDAEQQLPPVAASSEMGAIFKAMSRPLSMVEHFCPPLAALLNSTVLRLELEMERERLGDEAKKSPVDIWTSPLTKGTDKTEQPTKVAAPSLEKLRETPRRMEMIDFLLQERMKHQQGDRSK